VSISRAELALALLITLAGFALRFSQLDLLAVEHFDEGVYASNLLFPDDGFQYPNRFLYGPPLLPSLVEWATLFFGSEAGGVAKWVPFLPSLLLGSLTVPLVWWAGRNWFSAPAGVAAASLIALNDFHIVMSRSVLTDAPLLFFLLLAVWLIVESLSWLDLRLAVAGGVVTGFAWATKYNGWLPIAIAVSGTIAALIVSRKNLSPATVRVRDVVPLLVAFVVAAVACWSPVWLDLQDVGGYSRVAGNHKQYVVGPVGWIDSALRQEAVQRHSAGWPTLLSAWLAAAAAGLVSRRERSPWNSNGSLHSTANPSTLNSGNGATSSTGNDVAAGSTSNIDSGSTGNDASLASCENGSTGNELTLLIAVLATGALSGAIVLSPVIVLLVWSLTEFVSLIGTLHSRLTSSRSKASSKIGSQSDAETARQWKQWFAVWLCLAWLCGLLLTTPLYRPYPRLLLPLLGVGWLGTGAAIARLVVAFQSAKEPTEQTLPLEDSSRVRRPETDRDKLGGKLPSSDAGSDESRRRFILLIPVAMLCIWRAGMSEGQTWQQRTELAEIATRLLTDARTDSAGEKSVEPELDFVVYVYGEPGLLHHLPADRVAIKPVSDLAFARPGSHHPKLPTYLAIGPHAEQSHRFAEQFAELADRFALTAVYPYRPSDFVLLDDVAPHNLADNRASAIRVYRVKFE
jgi:dolichyl-phosphate-mannose-protein mannosyltransferase